GKDLQPAAGRRTEVENRHSRAIEPETPGDLLQLVGGPGPKPGLLGLSVVCVPRIVGLRAHWNFLLAPRRPPGLRKIPPPGPPACPGRAPVSRKGHATVPPASTGPHRLGPAPVRRSTALALLGPSACRGLGVWWWRHGGEKRKTPENVGSRGFWNLAIRAGRTWKLAPAAY